MDTATQNPNRPLAFEVPDPPEQFGQDGNKFYRAYDALAEEIDDDMTSSLKEQLDGMLIFAGLFAGINSTFLALTIPLLSADPSSDTNALLARTNAILTELAMGRNNTVPGNFALPSTGFSPSGDVFAVNALFALSLAFAIISSFLAVLGRQWLVYYRKRSGGGPDRKRWEQLKRFLGAQRWRMELILDDVLPSLLQAGLFIFCISLIIYFHYLSPVLSIIVGVPLYVALAIFVASALCTLWDRFCPFHSPLSHLLSWSIRNAPSIQNFLVFSLRPLRPLATEFAKKLKRWTIQRHFTPRKNTENFHTSNEPASTISLKCRDSIFSLPIKRWHQRSYKRREEESPESLQVIALQRTICTSDDPKSLLYATSNIFTITDAGQIDQLWSDNAFQERFLDQFRNSYTRMLQLRIRSQGNVAVAARQLYFCAAAHMMLCLHTSWRDYPGLMREVQKARETSVLSPGHGSSDSSTSMVRTTLGFALFQFSTYPPSDESIKRFHSHIIKYSDTLNRGDWRLLCVITWVIPNLRTLRFINDASIESLRRIYRGDVEQGITALERALNILVKRECEDLVECDRILTNMVRGINQIIIDDQTQLGITLRHKITLLEICERTMRSPRLGEAVQQGIRKMRRDLAQVWQQEFTLWAVERDIPARLLHMLEQYLATFRSIHQIDPTYHEYIDVLQAFGPPIRKLYTHEPLSEWVSDSLLKTCRKRISFRKTFNEFVLETDSISSQIQNNSGRIRDPDERWCHWNEDPLSMKALYFIFSDPPESGWNTLQRYLNPINDSSNAT